VLAYCEDGDDFAHARGSLHSKYSFEETQRELDGWRRKADGATRCETFNKKSPGICETCPHWGKINSPIGLGIRQNPAHSMDAGNPPNHTATPGSAAGDKRTAEERGQSSSERDAHAGTTGERTAEEKPSGQGDDAKSESADGPTRGALKAVLGDELLATAAPPRRWSVERFVPASETTMLGGDGGTGKTTLALQLGVASITGGDWLGLKVECRNVLYVSAEDPTDEIRYRLEQIIKRANLSNENLTRFKLIDLAGKDATIATFDGKSGLIKPTLLFSQIENAAREYHAGCVILDSIADFFGGNENERREVRAFVGFLFSSHQTEIVVGAGLVLWE
jgi:hypothetical protein